MRRLVDSLLLVLVVYSVSWPVLRGFGAAEEAGSPGDPATELVVLAPGESAAAGAHLVAIVHAEPGRTYDVALELCDGALTARATATEHGRLRISVPAGQHCPSGCIRVTDEDGAVVAEGELGGGAHTIVSLGD